MTPTESYMCTHAAVVIDNRDPEARARVRLRVPGLIDATDWVYPAATVGGGGPQFGVFVVPPIGADVLVLFVGGRPEQPRYLGGHWAVRGGEPEHPSVHREATDKGQANAEVGVWETQHWQVVLDDRSGGRRLHVAAKGTLASASTPNPDARRELVLELDAESGTLSISAPGGVVLRTAGTLDLQGTVIQIGGRPVLQTTTKPI